VEGHQLGICPLRLSSAAAAVAPQGKRTTAARIDGTADFFIARIISDDIYTDEIKGVIYGERRQALVEWKGFLA
jgi:hypothetical protein